jgi:hypothetical protein
VKSAAVTPGPKSDVDVPIVTLGIVVAPGVGAAVGVPVGAWLGLGADVGDNVGVVVGVWLGVGAAVGATVGAALLAFVGVAVATADGVGEADRGVEVAVPPRPGRPPPVPEHAHSSPVSAKAPRSATRTFTIFSSNEL